MGDNTFLLLGVRGVNQEMWLLFLFLSYLISSQLSQHNLDWCENNQAGLFLVTIVMLACYQKVICSSLLCLFQLLVRDMNKHMPTISKIYKGLFLCILM